MSEIFQRKNGVSPFESTRDLSSVLELCYEDFAIYRNCQTEEEFNSTEQEGWKKFKLEGFIFSRENHLAAATIFATVGESSEWYQQDPTKSTPNPQNSLHQYFHARNLSYPNPNDLIELASPLSGC